MVLNQDLAAVAAIAATRANADKASRVSGVAASAADGLSLNTNRIVVIGGQHSQILDEYSAGVAT